MGVFMGAFALNNHGQKLGDTLGIYNSEVIHLDKSHLFQIVET